MATITEQSIVDSSNSFEEAVRAFNNAPANSNLNYGNFLTIANKRFGIDSKGGTKSTSIDMSSAYKMQDIGESVRGTRVGNDLIQPSEIANGIADVLKDLVGDGGGVTKAATNVMTKILNSAISGASDIIAKEVELHNELNSRIGITGELSRQYRTELVESLPSITRMGYGFNDLKETVIGMMEAQGNFAMYNKDVLGDMSVTSRIIVGDLAQMGKILSKYELAGMGAGDALKKINEAGQSSLTLGLNIRKVGAEINENISKLNQYGFKNGYEGLTRMAQKSIEFKLSMQEVFELAEDLFDPEKAISLSAELQAIGGAIGDFNDPLKLMYMATNDAGGLQDAIIGVAGSLTTYNSEMGKFEISGVNLRRARAMAKELGIEYSQFAETAIKSAERSSAATELLSQGLNIDDKQKEFLTNISRMEGGKMVIDIPENLAERLGTPTRVALENLDQTTANALLENQKAFEKMSPEDIAKGQYTETQKLALTVSEISKILQVQFASAARKAGIKADENLVKPANEALKGLKNSEMFEKYKTDASSEGGKYFDGNKQKPMTVDNKPKSKTEEETKKPDYTPLFIDQRVTFQANDVTANSFAQFMMRDKSTMNDVSYSLFGDKNDYTKPYLFQR
jgi:hypothetical protein